MASQHQLVPRTARAIETLNTAVDQLAVRFGVPRPPVLAGRDPELQRIRELEAVGLFLTALVDVAQVEPAVKPETPKPGRAAIRA